MPIQLLSHGVPVTMVTNQVYALPAVKSTLYSSAAAPALEVANVSDFLLKTAVTLTGGAAVVAGKFIRTTAGNPVITLARD